MTNNCVEVIFSDKAYNELIRESFAMNPVETGGLLLGYVVNGIWVVMEVVPPGYGNAVHQTAYFEYDQDFVNYLIPTIANRYKDPLQLLGLWHRHPGSMDYFSSTDDQTNAEFASNSSIGTISGLVNIDPSFRLTMYHLDHFDGQRPRNVAYSKVDVEVGDNLIPDDFFALRYVDDERSDLHPTPTTSNTQVAQTRSVPKAPRNGGGADEEESFVASAKPEGNDGTPIPPSTPTPPASTTPTPTPAAPVVNPKKSRRLGRKLLYGIMAVAICFIIALTMAIMCQSPYDSISHHTYTADETEVDDGSEVSTTMLGQISSMPGYAQVTHVPYVVSYEVEDSLHSIDLYFVADRGKTEEALFCIYDNKPGIKLAVTEKNDTLTLTGKDKNVEYLFIISGEEPTPLKGKAKINDKEVPVTFQYYMHK